MVLRNVANYVPSVVVPLAVNAVLVFLYANTLSPAEYGLLNITLNAISILYAAMLSFLQSSAFRFYSAEGFGSDERVYISTYVLANLGIAVIMGCLLVLVNSYIYRFDWLLIALAIPVNGLYQFYLGLARLRDSVRDYTQSRVGASVLTLLVFSAFALFLPSVSHVHAVIAMYASYAVVLTVSFIRESRAIHPRWFSPALVRRSSIYGFPMMGVTVLGLLMAYSDQFLILHFLSKTDVGYYALGYRLSEMAIGNVTSVVLLVMTPSLMRVYDSGRVRETDRLITSTVSLDMWAVLPLVVVLVVFAVPIVAYLFPEYAAASRVVQLVAVASAFNSLAMILCKGLELPKRTVALFGALLASAGLNLAYNIVLIPVYGVSAAAHSSILAYSVYCVLLWWLSRGTVARWADWSVLSRTMVIVLAVGAMGMVIQSIVPVTDVFTLVVEVLLCVGAYLVGSKGAGLLRFLASGIDE